MYSGPGGGAARNRRQQYPPIRSRSHEEYPYWIRMAELRSAAGLLATGYFRLRAPEGARGGPPPAQRLVPNVSLTPWAPSPPNSSNRANT